MDRLFLFLLSLVFFAPVVSPRESQAQFSMEHFKVVVGAESSSVLQKRGIITYKGFQAVPIVAVQLFHPDLLLTGSALYYQKFLSDRWILRSRINANATADEPLFITSENLNDRIRRKKTTEWDLFLEHRWANQTFIRWQYSQDLVAHKGFHTELTVRLAHYSFYKEMIQPGLFTSIGLGNSAHNQYLYGDGADTSSINFFEYGLWVASPKVIDPFWPTFKLSYFQVVGDGNASATYVTEKSGWQATLLFAFQVY